MENWEFLLQRKGDKSWLPLESPSVEIVEGQYRLAARSGSANAQVGIAIDYRPSADVRHQPLQQKLVKRISHDGLMIVMPYTNFVSGSWRIECSGTEPDAANVLTAWKKTVEFDVIQVSSEFGSEWSYNDFQEDDEYLDNPTELAPSLHTNALGIALTEPAPLNYSSPILDIAEQRSTELVQSMFEEFALFDEESDEGEEAYETKPMLQAEIDQEAPLTLLDESQQDTLVTVDTVAASQPRILLKLQQPQYIVDEKNSFTITGQAYTSGEIEIILKHPQTLEVIFNTRYAIAPPDIVKDQLSSITINSINRDRLAATGVIPFTYEVSVPPPSEVQVLIGEVRIHPQQNFEQYSELFVMQQMIAVSYPASRVLPELIKEAQKYQAQDNSQNESLTNSLNNSFNNSQDNFQHNSQVGQDSSNSSSDQKSDQGSPQADSTQNPVAKSKPVKSLSLPPLPSKNPKVAPTPENPQGHSEKLISAANSISLPIITNTTAPLPSSVVPDLPQSEVDNLQQLELEFAYTDIWEDNATLVKQQNSLPNNEEPVYSFEEEPLPNYDELLEKPRRENLPIIGKNLTSNQPQSGSPNRGNRFLNKLQTLSAEAIANQKASQRNEDLVIDTLSEPANRSEVMSELLVQVEHELGNSSPITTIAEATSLAELDLELDLELDRLLNTELDLPDLLPDLILNEYVWEEVIDPNTFPVRTLSGDLSNSNPNNPNSNLSGSTVSPLSETVLTIRNLQESSLQTVSEQQEIPTPDIIIPEGEIISGTPMMITVQLPAIAPKFFVKFWIKDLQTRTIVDGPRWLLDFSKVPDTDFIETRTNISIPLSSIDVAFEAIAIESQTQRESHKVRVIRAVIPPNFAEDRSFEL
jgi:hypothetical protein